MFEKLDELGHNKGILLAFIVIRFEIIAYFKIF